MRNIPRLITALAFTFAAAASLGTSEAAAQVAAADAQPFIGNWALAIDAQGQSFTMDVNIEDAGGNVAAEVSSPMGGGATKVESISKSGENLVLSYSADAQGQIVPIVITLTPAGEELTANLDFADGMFETSGKGTRK